MILQSEIIVVHEILIDHFGGSKGLRDADALASALGRAYQTFEGVDLYPTSISKAAAIMESIVVNHPFMDGNKRTGYAVMMML